ncbi:MAG: peptide chain release factor N(5)-glutamine methyltransferase [Treponema sp.]|nr:peptide chain release factor N(5)-glutamine methyltransferase [Treponema sp.]
MNVREAIAQGSADLKFADIQSPGLDASLLLAFVLKTSRTSLIASGTKKVSEDDCAAFCELIERRCNGECVAYLTGKKEFRGLEFEVNKSVLVPRPDTETLVEAALELLPAASSGAVLDLCTGTGAVAVSLKNERPELEVWAADISIEALETAKRNAKRLGKDVRFHNGDLYAALPSLNNPFNMIVSNPPYIPTREIQSLAAEVQNEPRIALDGGDSGLDIIERIIDGAPDHLLNGGYLLLEIHPPLVQEIKVLLEKKGFKDIQLYKDLSGLQRVIGGRYEN